MKIWQSEVSLEQLNERSKNTLAAFLDITFTFLGDDFLAATMPVTQHVKQPVGIMHGGASCVLAETVGSSAANFCVDLKKFYCVGLDINTNHIRAVKSGLLTATAKPFHLGRTTHVWGIDIRNEEDKLISVNRLTLAVLSR